MRANRRYGHMQLSYELNTKLVTVIDVARQIIWLESLVSYQLEESSIASLWSLTSQTKAPEECPRCHFGNV